MPKNKSSEELKRRLKEHRNWSPRQDKIKTKLEQSRIQGPSTAQKSKLLKKEVSRGQAELGEEFLSRYRAEVERFVGSMSKDFAEAREVKQAIAFQTGIFSLDSALGGGLPAGAVEIYGRESVGKTTLLASILRAAQGQDVETALCISETLDLPRYDKLGVDRDNLIILRGESSGTLELARDFIIAPARRALFIDSMTGFRPRKDEWDNWSWFVQGWMSQTIPQISPGSCVVMVNQVRARRSKSPGKMFTSGTMSTAKKIAGMFDARLELWREDVDEDSYDMVVNITANVLAKPARLFRLPVVKAKGIDVFKDLVRAATELKVLLLEGSWYTLDATQRKLAQGEEKMARLLESDQDLYMNVLHRIFGA